MVKRAIILAAVLTSIAVLSPMLASAQDLDRPLPMSILFPRLLDNTGNCSNIQGGKSGQLGAYCAGIPNGVGSSAGTTSIDTRTSGGGDEAVRKRQERKRAGRGSSADDGELGGGWGMFVTTEYGSLNKSTSIFELGYEQETAGATLGVDYSFKRWGLLGAAFNYQHQFGDFAGQNGGYNNDLYSFILYGTVTPLPNLFIDLNAGYTRKEYGIDRRVSMQLAANQVPVFLGRIEGDTHSNDFRLGARVGYDVPLGAFTFGPRVGVNYQESAINGYRETGKTGIELIYGDQTVVSLTTDVGLFASYAISTGFGVVVPQLTGDWIHEFKNDQRTVPFTFVNAPTGTYRFLTESPDRDYFTIGAGAVIQLASGLVPFANYVEVLDYKRRTQRTVTLGLRFGF